MISLKFEKPNTRNYQKLVPINTDLINNSPLKNFAAHYRTLGGRKIPDEIVNMIIRKAQLKMHEQNKHLTQGEAFLQTSKTIRSISKIKGVELWRLSNAFCNYQYDFKVGYLKWLSLRMIIANG